MTQNKLEPKHVLNVDDPFGPLKYRPLSSIDGFGLPSSSTESSGTSEAQAKLYGSLADKPWLLNTDQPIALPKLSIENETSPIFTLSDFILEQNAKAQQDVKDSAVDPTSGERLKPTVEQMEELKHSGRLIVPSRNFMDQNHIWEVSGSFYLGPKRKNERFRAGLGGAVDHLVVHELDAIFGPPYCVGSARCGIGHPLNLSWFSALQDGFFRAFKHLWKHVRNFMPWTKIAQQPKYQTYNIDSAVQEAERLFVNYHMRKNNPEYCHQVTKEMLQDSEAKFPREHLREGSEWNLKYFPKSDSKENELRKKVSGRIQAVLAETRVSLDSRKQEELEINKERMRKSPRAALHEGRAAEAKWQQFNSNEIIRAFRTKDDSVLQVEAARLYMEKVRTELEKKDGKERDTLEAEHEVRLRKSRPILSASPLWRRRKLEIYERDITVKQQTSFEARLLEVLKRDEGSDSELAKQATEAAKLIAQFHIEEAPTIRKKMGAKSEPNRPIQVQIFRLRPDAVGNMYTTKYVHTDQPSWRAKLYGLYFLSWITKLSFGALRYLLNGPLSLRALLSPSPFIVEVGRAPPTLTPTLISRLKSFVDALCRIRQDFEEVPSYSILGKSIQRIFLQIYLALKGVIGATFIVTFMVLGTAIMTPLSLVKLVASPVLSAIFVSLRAVFDVLIFDLSDPYPKQGILSAFVGSAYYLLLPGLTQGIGATIALVVHPIIGVIRLVWSSVRYAWSSLRDSFFWVIIRRNVVVPETNDFLARRIQGPGLASNHLYRMPLQQAFQAVQATLDGIRLGALVELRRAEILAPSDEFEIVMRDVVTSFGFMVRRRITPNDICGRIVEKYERDHRNYVRDHRSFAPANSQGDLWDDFADQIRKAHPSAPFSITSDLLEQQAVDFTSHDASVLAWLGRSVSVSNLLKEIKNQGLYCQVAANEGLILAKMVLLTSFRQSNLVNICRLPLDMRSKFRLPEKDIQRLWRATTSLASCYADQIRSDLNSIAEQSEQNEVILPVAKRLSDAFWTNAGSRPGKDIEIVASHLLSIVFGGELMLEPLENVDKQLILLPKMSEEDKHLDFLGMYKDEEEYEIIAPKDVILDTE